MTCGPCGSGAMHLGQHDLEQACVFLEFLDIVTPRKAKS